MGRARRQRRRRRRVRGRLWAVPAVLLLLLVFSCVFSGEAGPSPAPPEPGREEAGQASEIPDRLLRLAEDNPETAEFVRQYPALHDKPQEIDLRAEAAGGTVPLLLQWDTRWGYAPYGDGLMAYTGCGPTCLSMAALALTGDPAVTPLAVARYAEAQGYYAPGAGSSWTLISEGSRHFGLRAEELPLSESRIRQALEAGEPVILVVGPGDFTPSGHYLVLTGCNREGFTLNDPNSRIRSGQTWTYDRLKGQIRNLWALRAD